MRLRTRAPALAAFALLAAGCLGGNSEPPPAVVSTYFQALEDGEVGRAYELTDIEGFPSTPGFALTLEHFLAFYERNPVEDFRIVEVFAQTITERLGDEGQPYWTVDADVTQPFGTVRLSVGVQGSIESLHRVELSNAFVPFIVTEGFPTELTVDGVRLELPPLGERVSITVLPGEHDIGVGDVDLRVATDPLEVLSGPAAVRDGAIALT